MRDNLKADVFEGTACLCGRSTEECPGECEPGCSIGKSREYMPCWPVPAKLYKPAHGGYPDAVKAESSV